MKVVGHGEKTLSALFKLEAGHTLPLHDHLYEQTGTLLKGALELSIADVTTRMSPGDTWTIPLMCPIRRVSWKTASSLRSSHLSGKII